MLEVALSQVSTVGSNSVAVVGSTVQFELGIALADASITDWAKVRHSPLLLAIILLAGAGTAILFLLGAVAYSRRRSLPYLLITLVLGTLVVRTIVGFGTVFGYVPMGVHHLVEHGFDFLIAVLLLLAIYRSGSARLDQRDYYDEQ